MDAVADDAVLLDADFALALPVWPDILSDRLPVIALVSRYLTN